MMRQFLCLVALVIDLVHAYPGGLGSYHKRGAIGSDGLPINGSLTNSLSPTGSFVTRSSASGIIFISSSTTVPLPTDSSASESALTGSSSATSVDSDISATSSTIDGSSTSTSAVIGIPPVSTFSASALSSGASISSTGPSADSTSSTSASLTGDAPANTITSPASLPSIDITSVSTLSTSIVGVTSNTEITTTDDHGNHVVVPFLWGCWFCGGGGLLLWGVGPLPGVYFPPVPPPFPEWPVITIGPDHVPTPDPSKSPSPTDHSPTNTASTTASSASCTGSTVTDYFVSCTSANSDTTSRCSTYSSSLITGCSVTPMTSTTVASCTAPASVDSDNLLPGEMAGAEYDLYDPRVSDTSPDWAYTVAVLASTGVVGAAPGSTPTSGPTTTTDATSDIPTITSSSTSQSVTTAVEQPPLCVPFQDPDNGDRGHCDCSSGTFTTTTPFLTSTGNICGYSSLSIPPPSTTPPPTTTDTNPFPFTTTDSAGDIIACASSSLLYIGVGAGLTYTECDGSSTTISTAPPPPSSTPPPPPPPPPPPSADCAFWDMGWGWKFEVYNIKGWSTDGGQGLHKNEHGCGALTGWEWSDVDSGGQAYFNLPFLIKSGCVERAIHSAGGPKISCSGQGVGKRSSDLETFEKKAEAALPNANPPNFNEAKISNAYNPPDVDITTVSHVYTPATWEHQSRSLLRRSGDPRSNVRLNKRGCIPSRPVQSDPGAPPAPAPAPPSVCNPIIPGVDECKDQIVQHGNVGRKVSLFYTGWGSNGAPGAGGIMARKYAAKNMCNMETVSWSGLCDGAWRIDVQKAIIEPFKTPGMSSDELFALNEKADPFLKNLAQAFAETSKGDVYVFIPNGQLPGNQWNQDSAWGGWEYPALTANTDVQRILRVDLDVTDPNNPTGTPAVIWDRAKGDGVASYPPKGIRGPSLPAGLPADQIPVDWDQTGSL